MTNVAVEKSPQVYARIGGAIYLILILVGMFAVIFVRDKMVVSGDAATTAGNIIAVSTTVAPGHCGGSDHARV